MDTPAPGLKSDLAIAAGLALVLGIGWTVGDWPALSALRLPDTDDVMRLQQVRDWLAGQQFSDLAQHRLGVVRQGGVSMHWSRLADLGPAALIWMGTSLVGRHAAEVAAVITWPLALFAAALALVGRIARLAGGQANGTTAVVVAAIAYPATTIFLPGRIDHHGLQVVLLLGALLATIGAPTLRRGLIAGGCAGASLIVGLETAPLLGVIGASAACLWAAREPDAEHRLAGWGLGAGAALILGRAVFASDAFAYPACDGFTLDVWRVGLIAVVGALALATVGLSRPTLPVWPRVTVTLAVTTAIGITVVAAAPRCLAPYGNIDPLLVRLWLARVGEAQSVMAAPVATAIGYVGLMVVGIAATAWRMRTAPSRSFGVLFAVQLAALAVTCAQLRGAYAGAILAAPALAAAIGAARARSAVLTAGAWLGSAGMLYPLAAHAARPTQPQARSVPCVDPAVIDRLGRLEPGILMAPIDTGAWGLAATRLHPVAGPYHRNDAGNLAAFRFFRGTPAAGRSLATALRVRYVLICEADVAAFDSARLSMAHRLAGGTAPEWLVSLPAPAGAHLYEVW